MSRYHPKVGDLFEREHLEVQQIQRVYQNTVFCNLWAGCLFEACKRDRSFECAFERLYWSVLWRVVSFLSVQFHETFQQRSQREVRQEGCQKSCSNGHGLPFSIRSGFIGFQIRSWLVFGHTASFKCVGRVCLCRSELCEHAQGKTARCKRSCCFLDRFNLCSTVDLLFHLCIEVSHLCRGWLEDFASVLEGRFQDLRRSELNFV